MYSSRRNGSESQGQVASVVTGESQNAHVALDSFITFVLFDLFVILLSQSDSRVVH